MHARFSWVTHLRCSSARCSLSRFCLTYSVGSKRGLRVAEEGRGAELGLGPEDGDARGMEGPANI